jgi:regulator of replication initiation timing
LVERRPEESSVGGSIPSLATNLKENKMKEREEKQEEKCQHKGCDKKATCIAVDGYMDVFHLCNEHFRQKLKEMGCPSVQ